MKLSTYELGGLLLEKYLSDYCACADEALEENMQTIEIVGYSDKAWMDYEYQTMPLGII